MGWSWLGNAILGAGGSLLSGSISQQSANAQIAAQRQFAQNKHQWEVADLKAAGLNPILSANSAGGSMQGAMAQTPDIGDSVTSSLSSAAQASIARKQQANNDLVTQATIKKLESETNKTNAETTDIEGKNAINYWSLWGGETMARTGEYESSAEVNYAKVKELTATAARIDQDIQVAKANEMRIMQEIEVLKQDIGESKSRQQRMAMQNKLDGLQGELVQAKTKTEDVERAGKLIQNTLNSYNIPKARYDAEPYEGTSWGSPRSIAVGVGRRFGIVK